MLFYDVGRTWRSRALRLFTWGNAGCNPIAIPSKAKASTVKGFGCHPLCPSCLHSSMPCPPSVLITPHLSTLSPPHSLTKVHRVPPACGASTEEALNETYALPKKTSNLVQRKNTHLQRTLMQAGWDVSRKKCKCVAWYTGKEQWCPAGWCILV